MTIQGVWALSTSASDGHTANEAINNGPVTWFQDGFNTFVSPVLQANPQLGIILTWVGVGVIIIQLLTIFSNYKKDGFKGWMIALTFTTCLTTALIAPTVMLPFWLSLVDTVIGLVLSILGVV